MITVSPKITQVENSVEVLKEFGIDIDLNKILIKEFDLGLPIDISCPF